jgi:hypothetical protein
MLKSRKLKPDGRNVRDAACRPQPNGTGGGFMAANGEDSSMIGDIVCLVALNFSCEERDRRCRCNVCAATEPSVSTPGRGG